MAVIVTGGSGGSAFGAGNIGFSPGWAGIFTLGTLLIIALACCCCWCCDLMAVWKRLYCKHRKEKRSQSLSHLENGRVGHKRTVPNFYVDVPNGYLDAQGRFQTYANVGNNYTDYNFTDGSHYYQSVDYSKIGNKTCDKGSSPYTSQENLYCEIDSIYY